MLPLLLLMLAQTGHPDALERRVRQVIADAGAEVAVAYRTLDGRHELLLDPDVTFHAASTMKVPVMIELYAQARAGAVKLEDPLPVTNRFRSIVDGSQYELREGEDSEKDLYASMDQTRTLADLCRAMIVGSSNLATNLLIEKLGIESIRRAVSRLGADAHGGMQVLRGVEDGKAFAQGLNNTTTARGLLTLFEHLARGTAVDAASDRAMIGVLKAQRFADGIPAGLPGGTPVAHKTGSITRINHDAGIVYARRPYVLVVLVRGVDDRAKSARLIAEVSRLVYAAAQGEEPGAADSSVQP